MIADNANTYPVRWMCSRLNVSPAGYYGWKNRRLSKRAQRDFELRALIRAAFEASRQTYGSPRIHAELTAAGHVVGRNKVAELMREMGLKGRRPKRFRKTTQPAAGARIAPDLVNRDFKAPAPNATWVSDITYVRTWEGWLYVATFIDLFSRRVVGLAIDDHMRSELVVDAFEDACRDRRPGPGLIVHSDRGSQYTSEAFREALRQTQADQSMGSKGDCYDNAVAESFHATLKEELVFRKTCATKRRTKELITDYIQNFYNLRRRHSTIGNLSPAEFELRFQTVRLAA